MAVEAVIFQQIVDINWDQAIYTASPNDTVNVAQFAAKGSGANIGVALSPKGTGYISGHVPNGAASGGNARGVNAVDWQSTRAAAGNVASGARSVIGGGDSNTASGTESTVVGGRYNIASGIYSTVVGGQFTTASGAASVACGNSASASAEGAQCFGTSSSATATGASVFGYVCTASAQACMATGSRGQAYLANMRSHGGFALAVAGSAMEICLPLAGKTTTNAEVILTLEAAAKPIMRANTIWTGILHITGAKSDGSAVARYYRQVTLSRVVNATSLVGSVITLGTDEAAGTSVNITANDTDEALSVGVTGVTSETWRWVAVFHGAELAIGA
jgi:hypothetical protein